jgi:hypothetical protein
LSQFHLTDPEWESLALPINLARKQVMPGSKLCLTSVFGKSAAILGDITTDHPGIVVMRTRVGGSRVVDMLSGEQLPRIC